jgi:hypothetical protein
MTVCKKLSRERKCLGKGGMSKVVQIGRDVYRLSPKIRETQHGLLLNLFLQSTLKPFTQAITTVKKYQICKNPCDKTETLVTSMEHAGMPIDKVQMDTETTRNVAAQLLVFLVALQKHAGGIHYDLHTGNVCIQPQKTRRYDYFAMGPKGARLYIPNMGFLVKVIDFDLTHTLQAPALYNYPNYGINSSPGALHTKRHYNQVFFAHSFSESHSHMKSFMMDAMGATGYRVDRKLRPSNPVLNGTTPLAALKGKAFESYRGTPPKGSRIKYFDVI